MELRMDLVKSLNSVNQMTIGRNYNRYCAILNKPTKTASDSAEMDKLDRLLKPYASNPSPETAPNNAKTEKITTQKSVVLNQRKLATAHLTGAQSLEVHRASVALGKLMSKPAEHLTLGEKADLVSLKARLLRFVGIEGFDGTDADFKVAV